MMLRRYCTISFYILLSLCATSVPCQGQRQQMSNGNIAYPENEEQDPFVQNAQVKFLAHILKLN